MIDVNIFDSNQDISVYINDDIDFTALKILYDNCLRVGSSGNSNLTIATVHPSLWFGEIFEHIQKAVKLVSKLPTFKLMMIENDQVSQTEYFTETRRFESDEELRYFLIEDCKYKSLALFSICKYLDMKTLLMTWVLRCVDVSTKDSIRDKKLDSIINI